MEANACNFVNANCKRLHMLFSKNISIYLCQISLLVHTLVQKNGKAEQLILFIDFSTGEIRGLGCQAQQVVISSTKSNGKPITSDSPWGSILGKILLDLFINDLDRRTKCSLRMFADDTKLRGAVDRPDGSAAIQKDLNRYEKWADKDFMMFIKGKYQVL